MAGTMFTSEDYEALHELVFRSDYPGYKPTVTEIPNGDGKADTEKRYAHVALKYLTGPWHKAALLPYLERAHDMATYAANHANVPDAFLPDIRYGALRVLDYPPGAISNWHEDFSLFTLMMFRDQYELFQSIESYRLGSRPIDRIRHYNPQAHLGQLGTEIGLGAATPHRVFPGRERQRSIVYFAIPDHDVFLPGGGPTVREWLNERMLRSRTEFQPYEAP